MSERVTDVEKIDSMIEMFYGMLLCEGLDKNRISYAKMVKELLDLKFKVMGISEEDAGERMTESEVRSRLTAAGVLLKGAVK